MLPGFPERDPVKIFIDQPPVLAMAYFGVPLQTVYVFFREGYSLITADRRFREPGEPYRDRDNFICMRCPDPDFFRVPCKDPVSLYNLDIHRTIATGPARFDFPAKCGGYNMEPKTDTEDREPEFQIFAAVTRPLNRGAATKDYPPAGTRHLIRGYGIADHYRVDIEITKHPLDQVVKLPKIIDYVDREHSREKF